MKHKTSKLRQIEKSRYSIITDNLDTCYLCGQYKHHLHEVFFGNNRINSMKYGCIVPLCAVCHTKVHNDIQLDLKLKKRLEKAFIEVYRCDIDYFIKIFHKNYL